MLMPKKDRIAIYELLFKEGVMVAKKDVHMPKHPELADKNVPNLHVMKAMQSLKSRGYVKEQFAWRHFYWYLTNEGIQYLRDYLHLPPEIVPATLRRQTRPETARPRPKGLGEERPARLRGEADRDSYRRAAPPPENKTNWLKVLSGDGGVDRARGREAGRCSLSEVNGWVDKVRQDFLLPNQSVLCVQPAKTAMVSSG
uniref:Ribosomal protein S10 n=1 Tax=Callorhinchus milii TaxID=7868 RepID=A0A4W3KB89_CALMI